MPAGSYDTAVIVTRIGVASHAAHCAYIYVRNLRPPSCLSLDQMPWGRTNVSVPPNTLHALSTTHRLAPHGMQAIDYRLASVTTTKTFLRRLMFEICSLGNPNAAPPLDDKLYFLTSYLAEASLLEYGLLAFLPSRVAAASFALAHVLLARPLSEEALTRLTGYCPADLSAPVGWLRQVHSVLAQAGGRYAVTVKYQSAATARAALVAPIVSLNDPRLAGACSDSGATAPLSRAGTAAPADAYAGRGWWQQQQL